MITEPLFYLVAIPLLSLVIPPIQAVGIMLPILLAMDISSVYTYLSSWDKRNLLILLPAAVIGIGIATLTAFFILPLTLLRTIKHYKQHLLFTLL